MHDLMLLLRKWMVCTMSSVSDVEYLQAPSYIAACDTEIVLLLSHPCGVLVPLAVSDIPANRWIVGNAPVAICLRETSPDEIASEVSFVLTGRETIEQELRG
jgi:hypothetical protein